MKMNQKTITLEESIAKAQRKQAELKADLDKNEAKLAKLKKDLCAELDKQKTQNCRKMGEIIYAKFGDDISPTEFEDMLTFIFLNAEIREYVEAEKKKRKAAEAAIVKDTIIDNTLSDCSLSENAKSKSTPGTTDIYSGNFDDADDVASSDDED